MTNHAYFLALPACASLLGCSGTASDADPPMPGQADGGLAESDAAVQGDAAPQAPRPVFTIAASTSGSIAVLSDSLRATYSAQGSEEPSHVRLSLSAEELDQSCSVVVSAELSSFGFASPATRSFRTVNLDIGAGTILLDECGWDQDYVLSEFSLRGVVTVGFAKARFDEDGPGLDLYLNRSWGLPGQTASIVHTGAAFGFAMDDQGVVNVNQLVQPPGGSLVQAVYQW